MKVKFTNKKVRSKTAKIISVMAGFLTTLLAFTDFCYCTKAVIGIIFIISAIGVYLVVLYRANIMTSRILKIRDTKVTLKFGDILKEKGKKVITFNEYFDTQVDDVIIATKTLNGIIVNQLGAGFIDSAISQNKRLDDCIIAKNCMRKQGGKTTKYKLGTICPCGDFFLVAFSQFDENDRAFHTFDSYVSCLMNMWNELDICYAQNPIVTTLPGSGITRFKGEKMAKQELLEIFIWTFKKSKVDFPKQSSLTIILPEDIKEEINLYEI